MELCFGYNNIKKRRVIYPAFVFLFCVNNIIPKTAAQIQPTGPKSQQDHKEY